MGLPGTFCVVCGGTFANPYDDPESQSLNTQVSTNEETDTQDDFKDHTADEFEWLEDIRLFGLRSSLRSLRNDAFGEEHHLPDDTSKEEPEFFDGISWTEGINFYSNEFGDLATLVPNVKGDMLFAMHAACAEIVLRVVNAKAEGMASEDALSSFRAYYDALRARCNKWLSEYNVIEWDYYGAGQYWGYDAWNYATGFEPFIADPVKRVDLTTFIATTVKVTVQPHSEPTLSPSVGTRRGLEALPAEILHSITDFLPAGSVFSLRLSSKTLRDRLPLNQRFYRDTLLKGTLLPYVWDLDPELGRTMQQRVPDGADPNEYWDWRCVARMMADPKAITLSHSKKSAMPYGFWNRCRVWTLVEEAERIEP